MHKRVLRQLDKHLGIKLEAEIPTELGEFVKSVSDSYAQAESRLNLLEKALEVSSQELLERNQTITKTLEDLKQAQSQLVHSAKMAGLGELVAGVSHELNTPAGTIVNAIAEVRNAYPNLLASITQVAQKLALAFHEKYFQSCQIVIQFNKDLATSEVRNLARELEPLLESMCGSESRAVSKNLVSVGFNKNNIAPVLDLLKTEQRDLIHQSLFELGMAQLHVRNIQIAIGRIIHLVKALKLYSHSENNKFALSSLPEDINNTLVILNNKIKLGVQVTREFEDIPKVNCFADQLNQVWTNLINNAIDAMNGKGHLTIRLKKTNQHKICVEIEDNGPGIDAAVANQLFTPYFTTKPKGVGTGLGLSISKEIVEKHKGQIEFNSKPGCTIFRVSLPIDSQNIGVSV